MPGLEASSAWTASAILPPVRIVGLGNYALEICLSLPRFGDARVMRARKNPCNDYVTMRNSRDSYWLLEGFAAPPAFSTGVSPDERSVVSKPKHEFKSAWRAELLSVCPKPVRFPELQAV